MNRKTKLFKTNELRSFLQSSPENLNFKIDIRKIPKISVITASYNQANFIEKTIRSVINQNYPKVEHIIIDGGSTDNTIEILKKYDSHISYWISEPDNGQTHAINKGLKLATGDLLGFQNSDDLYLPGTFWKVAEIAMKNENAGIIYGNFLHIDEHDNVIDEQLLGTAKLWIQIMLGPQIHNQAAFWRKTVSNEIGILDQNLDFDMDYEYFSRILAAGYQAVHISDFLGAFRHHDATKTSKLQDVSKKELQQVADYYHKQTTLLKYIPRKLGKRLAMLVKVAKHILEGRFDYIVRNRIKFK